MALTLDASNEAAWRIQKLLYLKNPGPACACGVRAVAHCLKSAVSVRTSNFVVAGARCQRTWEHVLPPLNW